jgi:antitoxin component of MazEF toxin-antitoxin module
MKQGNSLVVSLPLPFLHELGLLKGDYVELVLDEGTHRLYIKRAPTKRAESPAPPAATLPLHEVL